MFDKIDNMSSKHNSLDMRSQASLMTESDDFENIENQINKSLGTLSKFKPILNKKQTILSGPFEKIEEQAREESPVKSQRTKEERDMAAATIRNSITAIPESPDGPDLNDPITDWSLYDIHYPPKYHGETPENTTVKNEIKGTDGKVQRIYNNSKKEVVFSNKVRRETFPDGYTIVYFTNGDVKQSYPDLKVVYFFFEAKTTQTTFPNGMQIFKFANK
jgi:hypothetical protein